MKTIKTIASLLCAAVVALTFTQCKNATQAPATSQVTCDSAPALKIAYVDIDTLLTSYNLWIELNEETQGGKHSRHTQREGKELAS